MKYKG